MSVFSLCEQATGLVRGKRLILTDEERTALESLNYEKLTELHAQDEACVCALHFERVRDRLLEIYPFVFARKTATITNGILPSEILTVLCVILDGEPVEYEQTGGRINITEKCTVHYTARMTEISSWSSIFRDVFVYSLAVEICSAVTGKPEYVQLLETKAQELIQKAYQIGAIKAGVPLNSKNELYNRAIGLIHGQRTLKPESKNAYERGIDTYGDLNSRHREELRACERCSENVRDRLLQMYEWVFSRKTEIPAQISESVPGWKYTYILPEDCLHVLSVIVPDHRGEMNREMHCRKYSDVSGNAELLDYETAGKELYANHSPVYVRYTSRVTDSEEWPAIFTEAYVLRLAIEVAMNVTDNEKLIQILEQRFSGLIEEAKTTGAIRSGTGLPVLRDSRYTGIREVPYMDYSGLPTLACTPLEYCCGGKNERISGEFFIR